MTSKAALGEQFVGIMVVKVTFVKDYGGNVIWGLGGFGK